MLFINTRPTVRAEPINQALQQQGIEVFDLPLLEMLNLTVAENDRQKLGQLFVNNKLLPNNKQSRIHYDALIVMSPTAAELGCQLSEAFITQTMMPVTHINNLFYIDCPVIAVGNKTAQTLQQSPLFQQAPIVIPKNSSNEGMLTLNCINQLYSNSRVMIWCGKGGRQLLINELTTRQVNLDIIELYQRQLPEDSFNKSKQLVTKLTTDVSLQPRRKTLKKSLVSSIHYEEKSISTSATVLISSKQAFEYWQQLINQLTYSHDNVVQLNNFVYYVLGDRLAQLLAYHQLNYDKLDNLKPSTILNKLKHVN